MDLGLRGKRALVTGSTAGIGLAIAAALAEEGAQVVVNGRSEEGVAEAIRQIRTGAAGADVRGIMADLDGATGCERVVAEAPDVDILVNNVGIYQVRPFQEISDAEWARILELNLMSGVRLSRHHLPRMLARRWGRIVFISSESALQIPPEMIHYGVTKTAQLALARGLAELTRGTAVTVNAVLPGPTLSQGAEQFIQSLARQKGKEAGEVEAEFFRTARPTSLLQRFETPDEVAALVAFVAGERGSAVNGAALRVDGGVVRSIC